MKPDSEQGQSGIRSTLGRMFFALGESDYRRFWSTQFISNTGTWMQTVAQGWLVLQLTGSGLLLGVVGFANSVPVLLLMLPGGVLADAIERRRVLRFAQMGQALCAFTLAALVWFDVIRVWHIIVVALVSGTSIAFSSPTYQAFVIDLLHDRKRLPNAIAMNSLQFNLSRVFGPALAGAVLTYFGPFYCFFANGFSFLPILFVLGSVGRRATPPPPPQGGAFERLLDGFRYARRDRLVSTLLLAVAAASFFGYPYITLMPLVAKTLFGGHPAALARLMMTVGAGALVGSLFLAASTRRGRSARIAIVSALLLFGVAMNVLAFSRTAWLAHAALLVAGFAMVSCVASSNTELQRVIPDHLRGRILSMYTFSFFAFVPFGNLIGGAISERWGVRAALSTMGLALLVAAVAVGARMQKIRTVEPGAAPL